MKGSSRTRKSRNAKRIGLAIGIAAAFVAAVEIAARGTHAAHNHRVRNLGDILNIIVAGSGPPVIFLHGFRGSGRYWEPQLRQLAAHHQIIIVDLLGFGESPWPADSAYDTSATLEFLPGDHNMYLRHPDHVVSRIEAALKR